MALKQVMRYDVHVFTVSSRCYKHLLTARIADATNFIHTIFFFCTQIFNMHFYLAITVLALLCASTQAYDYLTATALVTNAANESALECWRFATPLIDSSEPGIAGSLTLNFNASSASYTIIPPRFNGSIHSSPTPQVMSWSESEHCSSADVDSLLCTRLDWHTSLCLRPTIKPGSSEETRVYLLRLIRLEKATSLSTHLSSRQQC
jgi:hypothetical protein